MTGRVRATPEWSIRRSGDGDGGVKRAVAVEVHSAVLRPNVPLPATTNRPARSCNLRARPACRCRISECRREDKTVIAAWRLWGLLPDINRAAPPTAQDT